MTAPKTPPDAPGAQNPMVYKTPAGWVAHCPGCHVRACGSWEGAMVNAEAMWAVHHGWSPMDIAARRIAAYIDRIETALGGGGGE